MDVSCNRLFLPGTFLEPGAIPTTQALGLKHIIIIIEFLTSHLWLGNIHLSCDAAINSIRLGGLICDLKKFLTIEHVPRITDFCSCIYVLGCRLSVVRLCDSDCGITAVDGITVGITCAAFCFHIAHIAFASSWFIIITCVSAGKRVTSENFEGLEREYQDCRNEDLTGPSARCHIARDRVVQQLCLLNISKKLEHDVRQQISCWVDELPEGTIHQSLSSSSS